MEEGLQHILTELKPLPYIEMVYLKDYTKKNKVWSDKYRSLLKMACRK